jgi:hypothetical protein
MKTHFALFITTFLFSIIEKTEAAHGGGLVQDFPATPDGVGDPDAILSENHRQAMVDKIEAVEATFLVEGTEVLVQIAVAVVEKVGLKESKFSFCNLPSTDTQTNYLCFY